MELYVIICKYAFQLSFQSQFLSLIFPCTPVDYSFLPFHFSLSLDFLLFPLAFGKRMTYIYSRGYTSGLIHLFLPLGYLVIAEFVNTPLKSRSRASPFQPLLWVDFSMCVLFRFCFFVLAGVGGGGEHSKYM